MPNPHPTNPEEVLKISAEIDLTKDPEEIRVIGVLEDVWQDLGLWLEVTAFMAGKAMRIKNWNEEQILFYCKNYLENALNKVK